MELGLVHIKFDSEVMGMIDCLLTNRVAEMYLVHLDGIPPRSQVVDGNPRQGKTVLTLSSDSSDYEHLMDEYGMCDDNDELYENNIDVEWGGVRNKTEGQKRVEVRNITQRLERVE
ncbi:unnamed protein product [Ilex paraguariensis]